MNKPLKQYVSKKEIQRELKHVFYKRLATFISSKKNINFINVYDITDKINIHPTSDVVNLIKLCKWNFITYLQNNGVRNTLIEMYILNLNVNMQTLISYQLMSNNYITTYII